MISCYLENNNKSKAALHQATSHSPASDYFPNVSTKYLICINSITSWICILFTVTAQSSEIVLVIKLFHAGNYFLRIHLTLLQEMTVYLIHCKSGDCPCPLNETAYLSHFQLFSNKTLSGVWLGLCYWTCKSPINALFIRSVCLDVNKEPGLLISACHWLSGLQL